MFILSIFQALASSKNLWSRLEKGRPPLLRLFCSLVLPLSLLPPLMLYHAASHHTYDFVTSYGGKPWLMVVGIFFGAEMLTFAAMGWLIRQVAASHQVSIDRHDAYLMAGIVPIPLWLSSLALLAPSFAFPASLSLLALAASCELAFHGLCVIGHLQEKMKAAAITQTVMGACLAGWALLLLAILPM